jgi:hypothetical protein
MRRVRGQVLGVWLGAFAVLSFSLAAARVHAQDKCCECGTVQGDESTDVVCFNDPANNGNGASGCPAACDACGLEVAQFNSNQSCSEAPTGPAGAGRCPVIYDNPTQGCGDVTPAECETSSDCADPGVCLKAVCVTSHCDIQADNTESCDDGDVCTANDACSDGACSGTLVAGCVPRPAPVASIWGLGLLATALFVPAVLILRRRNDRA